MNDDELREDGRASDGYDHATERVRITIECDRMDAYAIAAMVNVTEASMPIHPGIGTVLSDAVYGEGGAGTAAQELLGALLEMNANPGIAGDRTPPEASMESIIGGDDAEDDDASGGGA